MKKVAFIFLLLLTACAAAEPVTWTLQISFFDDMDETAVAASVYVGETLMCETMTTCRIDFGKESAEAQIPLRIVAAGYEELTADITDTLDQSGTFVLNVTLIPLSGGDA